MQSEYFTPGKVLGFNPYFYGTSTSTVTNEIIYDAAAKVSILIFMEHLLQQEDSNHKKVRRMDMFQSLFLWNIYFNCH